MEDTRDAGYLQLSGSGFADITGNFRFSWGTEVGKRYRVEESADLVTWADVGEVTTASGYEMSYEAVGGISAKRYFRVRELDSERLYRVGGVGEQSGNRWIGEGLARCLASGFGWELVGGGRKHGPAGVWEKTP